VPATHGGHALTDLSGDLDQYVRKEEAKGLGAVGVGVLLRGGELGGGLGAAGGEEDGVVAEAVGTAGLAGDGASPLRADDGFLAGGGG
jgi:hypothetical protein